MSELKGKLQEDVKQAMRAREQERLTTLRGLMAAIKQVEVDTRQELSDAQVTGIIQSELKKRRDALQYAEQQQREDLIGQNKREMDILQSYLGAPLSEEELSQAIEQAIQGGAQSIAAVMGELSKSYKGRFDGRRASELVKSRLRS